MEQWKKACSLFLADTLTIFIKMKQNPTCQTTKALRITCEFTLYSAWFLKSRLTEVEEDAFFF